ncbi:AAA family ATPase [Azospirillum argentinense]
MFDDHFSHMTWQEFEDFVIDLLARVYGGWGLHIEKTPYQNDGGKDGYGSLLITPQSQDISSDLSLTLRLWAEVKKRSSSKVDLGDIGGHLILAIHRNVNKIIFITNGEFSDRVLKVCRQVGRRLNVSVGFIDGLALQKLQNRHPTQPLSVAPPASALPVPPAATQGLFVRTGFVAGPEDELDTVDVDLVLDRGEIGYWVCEVSGQMADFEGELALLWLTATNGNLQTALLSPPRIHIEALESLQRIVFACWRNAPGRVEAAPPVLVHADTGHPVPVTLAHGRGAMNVQPALLTSNIPSSRATIIAEIKTQFGFLAEGQGVQCAMIVADAGAGKSFLVDRVRQDLLGRGVCEVRLDGERDNRVDTVVKSILRQSFPLPADMLPTVAPEAICHWLDAAEPDDPGVHRSGGRLDAVAIAALMKGGSVQAAEPDIVNLAAATLINASSTGTLLLTFEDLHKANASVLDFLQRLAARMTSRKKGRIFLLFTTRPYVAPGAEDTERAEWESALRSFDTFSGRVAVYKLGALRRDEGCALLQASLRHLSAVEADLIMEQVGTNPFFLREALQFLRTSDTIAVDDAGAAWLQRPEGIREAVRQGTLLTATDARLKWLTAHGGDWLERFLVAAACLGKRFSRDEAAAVCGGGHEEVERGLKLCADHDVLRHARRLPGEQAPTLAFDHDLIRLAVLRDASEHRIAEVAQTLYDRPAGPGREERRMVLAYLAGAGDACLRAAEALLESANAKGNHWEALQHALIRLSLLLANDRSLSAEPFLRPHLELIDEAFTFVDPPLLQDVPEPLKIVAAVLALLDQMGHVGRIESELSTTLITLGLSQAEFARDWRGESRLRYFDGLRLFGRNQYEAAYEVFQNAEAAWREGATARSGELADVRLWIAICERHLGRLHDARATMVRALRLRCGPDWKLFEQVAANLGAFYMYADQKRAESFWSKGLRVARLKEHTGTIIHFMNDLAHLQLMRGDYEAALGAVDEADALVRNHQRFQEGIRCNLFRACAFLAQGRRAAARRALEQAEEQALANNDLRRLWRVRSNMATLAEIEGDAGQAAIRDRQSLEHMPISIEFRYPLGPNARGNRVVGALINIILRQRTMPDVYRTIPEILGPRVWEAAVSLTDELLGAPDDGREFVGGIACLFHPVGDGTRHRFLITE